MPVTRADAPKPHVTSAIGLAANPQLAANSAHPFLVQTAKARAEATLAKQARVQSTPTQVDPIEILDDSSDFQSAISLTEPVPDTQVIPSSGPVVGSKRLSSGNAAQARKPAPQPASYAQAARPGKPTAILDMTPENPDRMTLEQAQATHPWIGRFQPTDISENWVLPQLAHTFNMHGWWNAKQTDWMKVKLPRGLYSQIAWEARVARYFRRIRYGSRTQAFTQLLSLTPELARYAITLATAKTEHEVILMAKDVRHPAPQDTETSLIQLKHWAEEEATRKMEQLHEVGEEISNRARDLYPDSLDDAIEEIPYAELDPELLTKAHEFNTLRFAMAHLRAVTFTWDPNAKLIRATAETRALSLPDASLALALVVFRPEATHPFAVGPQRQKTQLDIQLLTDLLTNIEINISPSGLRIYSALQKPENLVSFTFHFPSNRHISPEQAFWAHCAHFHEAPNFYFDPESVDIPRDNSWTTTLRGHIILEDDNVPLSTVRNTFESYSIVKLDAFIPHCHTCGLTTHSRYQCPSDPCRYCKEPGHWKSKCPVLQKAEAIRKAREATPIRPPPGPSRTPLQQTPTASLQKASHDEGFQAPKKTSKQPATPAAAAKKQQNYGSFSSLREAPEDNQEATYDFQAAVHEPISPPRGRSQKQQKTYANQTPNSSKPSSRQQLPKPLPKPKSKAKPLESKWKDAPEPEVSTSSESDVSEPIPDAATTPDSNESTTSSSDMIIATPVGSDIDVSDAEDDSLTPVEGQDEDLLRDLEDIITNDAASFFTNAAEPSDSTGSKPLSQEASEVQDPPADDSPVPKIPPLLIRFAGIKFVYDLLPPVPRAKVQPFHDKHIEEWKTLDPTLRHEATLLAHKEFSQLLRPYLGLVGQKPISRAKTVAKLSTQGIKKLRLPDPRATRHLARLSGIGKTSAKAVPISSLSDTDSAPPKTDL